MELADTGRMTDSFERVVPAESVMYSLGQRTVVTLAGIDAFEAAVVTWADALDTTT